MNKGAIAIVGAIGSGADFAARQIQLKYGREFYVAKKLTTDPSKKDMPWHKYVSRDEMLELSWNLHSVSTADGHATAYEISELQSNQDKTPIFVVSPDALDAVLRHTKKEGDSLMSVVLKQTNSSIPSAGLSSERYEKMLASDEKIMNSLKSKRIAPSVIIDDVFSNIEDYIIPEYKFFIKNAQAIPDFNPIRDAIKNSKVAHDTLLEYTSGTRRSEKVKETHTVALVAAAIATAVAGGPAAAVIMGTVGLFLSKIRQQHLENNWFLQGEDFSPKDGLMYSILCGMNPSVEMENIKTKEDLEQAISNFKTVSRANSENIGIIEKALLAIGDKVIETSMTLDMMSSIKAEKEKIISEISSNGRAFSGEETLSTLSQSGESDVLFRKLYDSKVFDQASPAETDEAATFNIRR